MYFLIVHLSPFAASGKESFQSKQLHEWNQLEGGGAGSRALQPRRHARRKQTVDRDAREIQIAECILSQRTESNGTRIQLAEKEDRGAIETNRQPMRNAKNSQSNSDSISRWRRRCYDAEGQRGIAEKRTHSGGHQQEYIPASGRKEDAASFGERE